MTWMLRLYPRRWRERYEGEVRELLEAEPSSFRLFVDLLAGAVDARFNPQLTPATTPQGGSDSMTTLERLCARSRNDKYNGPWMIGASLFFVILALVLDLGFGQALLGQTLLYSAFPLALILASENRHLERWPRPVRWIVLGVSLMAMFGLLLGITVLADRL